ncbi:Hybrid PKS-NRPS synthetase luc5 [Fusarium solani]
MGAPNSTREPIAIVGTACRFPGGANTPSKLWDLLCEKRDVQTRIPPERFNPDAFYHRNGEKSGCTDVKKAYLLTEDIRAFDASFFKINPREAEAMDPQQRLLLETVYEATEAAGLPYEDLKGSNTAVYVGSMTGDYHEMLLRDPQDMPKYMATGTARSILSNRVSYFFDWKGPSMTIDTACSSSLVAVHEAVTALRLGVSNIACAAGTNLILGPEMMISESKLHMLSPTGRSKMWDASANGYARGEGTAAIMMKTLSQALSDGDHVYGIIRETGVNSDGHTNGITLPSSESQKTLIRQTYANAGLDLIKERCQFFEAHGTGTPAGDPIEARAIHEAFFEDAAGSSDQMFVGSVKTAIGHLEGCAGLAGLIKALEAVRRGVIPPNQLFENLNPALKPFAGNLSIPTETLPWPEVAPGTPRRASVNSFGFGGTNAHAIIESFDNTPQPVPTGGIISYPLVLSANSEKSLRRQISQLHDTLQNAGEGEVQDTLYTLAQRRSQLPARTYFSGHTQEELLKKLSAASAEDATITVASQEVTNQNSRILGVFTGQGAQWPTMGREILKSSAFAGDLITRLETSLASLQEPPTWTLSEQILADPESSRLGEAAVSQPVCTAVQLMLVELLRQAGITFSTVIGHSSGEIAAAYAAGFLTPEDAIRIAYCRGVCAKLAGGEEGQKGSMMAVGLSYEEAACFCEDHFPGCIDVAASNAPSSATLSGDKDAILEAKALLDEQGTFARVLKVDTAYHSRHMQPCAEPYMALLRESNIQLLPGDDSCEWFSSVIGERMSSFTHGQLLTGEYWVENMVKPVLFTLASELAADSKLPCHVALEVGPHPALKGPFSQTYKRATGSQLPYQGALTRNVHDVEALSDALGFIWARLGKSAVNFASHAELFSVSKTSFSTNLPSYPWDHSQSFWKESRKSANFRQRTSPPHPLLGTRSTEDATQDLRWLNILHLDDAPWLEGHKVEGLVVYPAAAYLVMAMESAKSIDETKTIQLVELFDVQILSAIQLSQDSQGVETLFTLEIDDVNSTAATARWSLFTSMVGRGSNWKCNAKGHLRVDFGSEAQDSLLPSRNPPVASLTSVNIERFYTSLAEIGLGYTGAFKHLATVQRQSGFATAKASQMNTDFSAMIHPALLDSAFQSLFAAYCWPDDGSLAAPFVPTFFKSLRIVSLDHIENGQELAIDSYLTDTNDREITADLDIFTSDSEKPLLQLQGLTCTSLLRPGPSNAKELYTQTKWEVDISCAVASLDVQQHDAAEDLDLVDLCERLSYYYLRELNRKVDRSEVPAMDWHFQRIFEWIDYLFPIIEAGKHTTIRKEWSADEGSWLLEQASKFPDQVDLLLIRAVGENLTEVVRKETTMLEHMVRNDVLNRFYKFGLGFQRANGYLSRISKQIAHRYPQMKILEIGAGTGGATKGILESLGTTFESYTFTDISTGFFEAAAEAFEPWVSKIIFKPLNVENDPVEQGFLEAQYDFIVASNVLHATKSLSTTMRNVRRLLKPGGQLLLLEVTSDIVRVRLMMSGLSGWWLGGDDGRRYAPTITVPEWDSLLRSTGFSGVDHTVNDFYDPSKYMTSVMLSQAVDDHHVDILRKPLNSALGWLPQRCITIIGGKNNEIAQQVSKTLLSMKSASLDLINHVDSFEQLASTPELPLRAVLILEDLDEPVLKSLTSEKLAGLQRTINDSRQILWVSKGCQKDEPYANMSTGLCRSLASEYPHIQLQHIDMETGLDSLAVSRIVEALIRIVYKASLKQDDDLLWSHEAELILEDEGRWLIPRILPDDKLNDHLNAGKMKVKTNASLADTPVEIQQAGSQWVISQTVPSLPISDNTDHIRIKASYSTLHAVRVRGSRVYLSYGHRVTGSTTPVIAFSETAGSIISVPESQVFDVPQGFDIDQSASLRSLVLTAIVESVLAECDHGAAIIVHEADNYLGAAFETKCREIGLKLVRTTSKSDHKDDAIFIHPLAPERVVKKALPHVEVAVVVDLSGRDYSVVDSPLRRHVPSTTKFLELSDLIGSVTCGLRDVNIQCVQDAIESSFKSPSDGPVVNISEVSGLQASETSYATVVDWSIEKPVSVQVQPLQANRLLRSDRTYLLAGCTGGLGKALCRWMVAAGVRHLALTTRNVEAIDKVWLEGLQLQGADVRLFQVDVGDKAALERAHAQVTAEMPPICGVANAAMVLSDRSFGELKVGDFDKVFGPKVRGTQNLHELFQDEPLDFFIMFSSLASVVGNRGQANYAAANLFMTAVAEQRRAKNLAASVIHIGMILGVGYVSSTGAYEATLRQYNYMPISEPDFLNMFSEAILVGQPGSSHAPELITGLNRYSLQEDAPKFFWHENMRFSHHTLEEQHQESTSTTKASISQRLAQVQTPAEMLEVVEEEFCTKLERMLQAESGTIKVSQPLMSLGVDSLIAAEIRSWFFKELDVDMPVLEILNTASVAEICSTAVASLATLAPQEQTETTTLVTSEAVQSLNAVSGNGSSSSRAPTEFNSSTLKSGAQSTQGTSVSGDKDTNSVDGSAKVERNGPLSFAQERIWFLQQYLQDATTFNVTMAYRITGPLRVNDLESAFQKVIQRHESLRTGFHMDPETTVPTQIVYEQSPFGLEQRNDSDITKEFEELQNTHYDLENGRVLKAIVLTKPDTDEHILLVGFHHIALDGFSAQILVRDLAIAYAGGNLAPLDKGYLDFAVDQRAAVYPAETLQYWKTEFETLPPALPVFDFAETKTRLPLTDYKTRVSERTLQPDVAGKAKSAARALAATPFHVYLAALQVLLSDFASTQDVCIGITDANKNDAAHMDTIGFFVNLLPLRFQLSASQTLAELVSNTKAKANGALTHSRLPFDVLLDELKIPRSTSHSPLFQVVLNFKMGSTQKVPLADCQAEVIDFKDVNNPYDLAFDIETYPDGSTSISVKSQEYLYTKNELDLILESYINLLSLFEKDSSKTLGEVSQCTPDEAQKTLTLGRGERIPSPSFDTLSHYFEDWVKRQPDAIVIRDDQGTTLSYSQLKSFVNNIAATLEKSGLTPGARVGVYCEPSIFIIASLLAIAEVGGVYVPLDPQNPIKRLQLIVDDCEPEILLFDESTKELAPKLQTNASLINIYNVRRLPSSAAITNRAQGAGMAYMFYTSGTTGVPKGVALTHANLVHHIDSITHFYDIKRGTMLQQAPLGFDMSLTQMSLSTMLGGTLVVASSEARKDPLQLAKLMLSERVTHTFMTPTLAVALIHHGYEYLVKCVGWEFSLLSGEAFRTHVISEFQRLGLPQLKLFNGYGPTEITINSSSGLNELDLAAPRDTRNPTIGLTLPNYSCYILDEDLKPVRPGHAGELFVGGAGIAVGYLRRDELNKERFLSDPFASSEDVARGWARMYRTGDKAKFLPDGRIVFLGRIAGDSQIKLRGFRIELEDIANTIVKSSGGVVSEAAVSFRQGVNGPDDGAFLVAFAIISQAHRPENPSSFLKQLLKDLSLPRYMIPAKIVQVEHLPMGPTGKLDQNALDVMPIPQDENVHEETLTTTQERLRALWFESLPAVAPDAFIGSETDFFEAGGNSLRIVMLREHIAREFGVMVSVFDLFQASTLGGMAAKIDGSTGADNQPIIWEEETRVDIPSGLETPDEPAILDGDELEVALTGATGFLGLAILRSLLKDERISRVHCLAVRSPSKARDEVFKSPRVVVYHGDLSSPRLGLSEDEFGTLSKKLDIIIHNGAEVSFLKSYQALKKANVSSTKELAQLASGRQIPFHFVSTGGVVNLTDHDGLPEISVSGFKPPIDGTEGYAASKWASEVILESHAERAHLPVWIHRPANVTGAAAPATDLMGSILQYSTTMQSLPEISNWKGSFDFVPVEQVADEIAASIHESRSSEPVYRHHCGDQKISVSELSAHLEAGIGAKMEIIGVDDWLARARSTGIDETTALLVEKMLSGENGGTVPWLRKGE